MSLLRQPAIPLDSCIFRENDKEILSCLQCSKCEYILRDAVQLLVCGHRLCRECAEKLFEKNPKPTCPMRQCGEELTNEYGPPYRPDRAVCKEISRLSVKCLNCKHGCQWSGVLERLGEHLMTCHYSSQEILTRSLKEGFVLLVIIKLILMGPPGVGKTSFKSLLFNWPPVLQHHSTGIASRPVQAVERMIGQDKGTIWEKVTTERLSNMIAGAMNRLNKEAPVITEGLFTSIHGSMVQDLPSSTQLTSKLSVQKKSSELQPNPMLCSEKILKELDKGEVSGELYKSTWIYLLDSGGQPHFTDVSRAFIRSNTAYIIAIKLTDKLSDKPPFLYSLKGNPFSNSNSELCMTNLQLIKYFVRSIVSLKSTNAAAKSLIFIIGTCSDLYYSEESKMEPIQDKNVQLVSELKEFREHLVFFNEISDEVIHPVNNICDGEEREKLSSKLRKSIVNRMKKIEVQVPIRWFVFEIMMKDQVSSQKGIVSLDECYYTGKILGMENYDVTESLKYLDSLSLVLYFPQVLHQVIFTNPQYLLDMLSALISISFVKCYLPPGIQSQLREKGIFEDSLLDELATLTCEDLLSDELILEDSSLGKAATTMSFAPPLFTKKEFLKLLIYLRIVAPISSTSYFIPVVLPVKEKIKKDLPTSDIEPMILQFKCGVVPQGLFLSVVVALLNRGEYPKFIINGKVEQLRHAIDLFSKDLCARVLLIEEFEWIEVHFWGDRNNCHALKAAILEAISSCADLLAYNPSELEVDVKVLCQLPHEKGPYPLHPVIINEKKHKINCSYETHLCEDLRASQSCWFNVIGSNQEHVAGRNSFTVNFPKYFETPTKHDVLEQLVSIDAKWREIGNGFRLSSNYLDGLSQSLVSNQIKLEHVIQKWIELDGQHTPDGQATSVTWETVIDVIKGPGLQNHSLAKKIYQYLNQESRHMCTCIPVSQDSRSILSSSTDQTTLMEDYIIVSSYMAENEDESHSMIKQRGENDLSIANFASQGMIEQDKETSNNYMCVLQ